MTWLEWTQMYNGVRHPFDHSMFIEQDVADMKWNTYHDLYDDMGQEEAKAYMTKFHLV